MIETILLFAQGKTAPGGSALVQFIPFLLIFVLFWFLIIRPQRKRDKEHQGMLNSLKTGDRIITRSGMYGDVAEVTPQDVVIEISPRVKVTLQKQAIAAIIAPSGSGRVSSPVPTSEKEEEFASKKKKKRKK